MKQLSRIVLASASPSRRRVLENAGLKIDVVPSDVDEGALRDDIGEIAPEELAARLADAKAADVARRHPTAPVVGADQVLVCEGRRFDKAGDMARTRTHLAALQGRDHQLIAAVSLYLGGEAVWQYRETARLTMRPLNGQQIDAYLDAAGPAILGSVGCYHLEGLGARLFDRVEGDFFTILGLPLLPLLESLRRAGILD